MNRICGFERVLLMIVFVFVAMSASATITVRDYWRLGEDDPGATNNGTGVTSVDSAGSDNLTFHGPANYSSDVSAQAASLTKSSLSINFTNLSFLTGSLVSTTNDNFGIECWVKPITTNDQVIVYNGNTATSGWGIMIYSGLYSALYGGKVIFGTHVAAAGTWVHLALVRTNGSATLYFNGAPAGTSTVIPNTPAGGFAIASPPQALPAPSQMLTGRVDEVRFFSAVTGQFKTTDLLLNQHTTNTVSPVSLTESPAAGVEGIGVNTSLASALWSASTTANWIHLINPHGVNSNYYVMGFNYDTNPGPTRIGIIVVSGQNVTVTQAGSNYVSAGVLPLPANGLNFASSIAADTNKVYIADLEGAAIDQWIPGNMSLTTLLDSSSGINYPLNIFLDSAHNLLIGGYANNGQPFLSYGDFEYTSSNKLYRIGLGGPITEDFAGNIYGNDDSTNLVMRFDWSIGGSWVAAINSGLTNPAVVAADRLGNLYINSDNGFNRVTKKWNPTTQVLTNFSLPGVAFINAMAVDGANNFYIADAGNSAFERWNSVSQTLSPLVSQGGNSEWSVAVDPVGNVYFCGNGLPYELPRVFVDSTAHDEPAGAGTDSISAVAPATANLSGFYQPTSDQPWLTITGVSGGSVGFAFTSNTDSSPRTANIHILGVSISVTQSNSVIGTPPLLLNPHLLGDGSMQFTFTNLPGASFTVLTSTNLFLPLADWTIVGAPSNIGPGLFQFTSGPMTNDSQRFYDVSSP